MITRIYTSFPTKTDTRANVTGDVPDMGALDLPFQIYGDPVKIRVAGTTGELDTLEGDSNWVRE